mmetsp:Transcript_78379/g.254631  ORF Transcript_78379/g.254631 Transcript_78379/m.254631 type:complete len:91 (+) Transcript_78379:2293-2565(+)
MGSHNRGPGTIRPACFDPRLPSDMGSHIRGPGTSRACMLRQPHSRLSFGMGVIRSGFYSTHRTYVIRILGPACFCSKAMQRAALSFCAGG